MPFLAKLRLCHEKVFSASENNISKQHCARYIFEVIFSSKGGRWVNAKSDNMIKDVKYASVSSIDFVFKFCVTVSYYEIKLSHFK